MGLYLLVDLLLLVVAACVVLRCWRLGMVASLVRLVGTLVAGVGAWIFAKPVAEAIYNAVVHSRLVEYVSTQLPAEIETTADELRKLSESMSGLAEQFGELINDQISTLVYKFGLSGGPLNMAAQDEAGKVMTEKVLKEGSTVAEALVDTLMRPVVLSLMNIIVFLVLFGVLTAVVAVLFRIALGVNHLPLIGGVNHLLGLAFGVVEAVIIVFLLCMALLVASSLLGSKVEFLSWDNLQRTVLYSRVVALGAPGIAAFLG